MRNEYFNYLCHIVGKKPEFSFLLKRLYEIEFYSIVPNDDNRGADGEHLRDMFLEEVGPQGASSLPNRPCTILEMMIGIAQRLEFELDGSRWWRQPDEWFWILVENLGLDWENHDFSAILLKEIDEKIENLLERRYSPSGYGGLFPLKVAQKDQRDIEIWYQMSAWIIENYPI